jgi:soluble cytochrome b562
LVRTGDLQQAHLALEGVRPVFQEVFKRNGFSMLSVTLVDFHDAMELMLEAGNAKDAAKLQALYPQVNDKMKAVEAEASDADIQVIRQNLDALLKAAQDGQTDALPQRADQLKTSFVKVYLQRG